MELFIAVVLMVIMGIIPVLTFVDLLSMLFSGERVFKGLKNALPLVMLAPIVVMFLDLGTALSKSAGELFLAPPGKKYPR